MQKVIFWFSVLWDSKKSADDKRRKPNQEQLWFRISKNEIQDRKHQENQKEIWNLKSKDLKLSIKALADWSRF